MKTRTLIYSLLLATIPWAAFGQATFTKITTGPIVSDRVSSWCGLWGDYDGDGRLDLVVLGDWFGSPARSTRLYHNDGNGQFTTVTNQQFSLWQFRSDFPYISWVFSLFFEPTCV